MVFDVEEYEDAKKLYMQMLLDAVDESEKTNPNSGLIVALYEGDIAEESSLPRHLVDRVSDDLSEKGILQCMGGIGPPNGRSYCFTTSGLIHAEKLRYDKSWLAKRRKVMGLARKKGAEGVVSGLKRVAGGIGLFLAGCLTTAYGPTVVRWLKSLMGMK
jgi:hypothetical protein